MQVRENMQEAVFWHSLDNPDLKYPIWCIIVAPKYKGKFRIESTRLPTRNYASPGFYFITICTQAKAPYFGEIMDEEMHLSPSGAIVSDEWLKTGQIRTYISLDERVIMPNHVHSIIIIEYSVETPRRGVSTKANPNWKPNSLGSIINQFKSKCTKGIRGAGNSNFAWQSRYYDHIIRDQNSLDKIRTYIRENPVKWESDQYHPHRMSSKL